MSNNKRCFFFQCRCPTATQFSVDRGISPAIHKVVHREITSTRMLRYYYKLLAIVIFLGCIYFAPMLYRYTKDEMFSKIELASCKVNESEEYGMIGNETVFKLPFIYLTQTEKCLPFSLLGLIGDMEICNCDVIALSYKAACAEVAPSHVTYLFDAQSTWSTGRNALYVTAMKRKPGYHYYILLDDDVVFKYNSFTPREMMYALPLKSIQRWLLEYEPALGVLDYAGHHNARFTFERRKHVCGFTNDTSLVLPVVWFDAIFNAFHYNAVAHILPYDTQFENVSWYMSTFHSFLAVELKFRGQALLFAPVTVKNPAHREYPRYWPKDMNEIWRTFLEKIQRGAPKAYQNHSIFEDFKKNLHTHDFNSSTYCMQVTRHLRIVPYAHLN